MSIQIGNKNSIPLVTKSSPAFLLSPVLALSEKKVGGYTRQALEDKIRNYGAGFNEFNPDALVAIRALTAKEGSVFDPGPWISKEQKCTTKNHRGGRDPEGGMFEGGTTETCKDVDVCRLQQYLAGIFSARGVEIE